MLSWYQTGGDGVTIHVHAQPGARRTEVIGLHGDCVKLRLASPPVDGKANACLIEFLARRLGVKRSQVTITRGTGSRRKTVFVAVARLQPAVLLEQEDEQA
ncbi:MAG: YggU family protein [Betaproteobacteria bacterium RIFCSPLOWO2_12_FULL_64_23]|nr:MAG: YggU family protein [Betaproteobacteria bacterium RIFCSPLOWO2_12_FULL_64_23]